MTMQLAAPILLTRDILEYFKINGGGSFVHISSIQGISALSLTIMKVQTHLQLNIQPLKQVLLQRQMVCKILCNSDIRVNCVSPVDI